MHIFEAVGDPVRRRIVELLGDGDRWAGEIASAIGSEFGVSQPAVSNQLRVLRQAGVVASSTVGARRRYSLLPVVLDDIDEWVARRRSLRSSHPDRLSEVAGSEA